MHRHPVRPGLSWADVDWLRSVWDGPLVIKGVQTVADAVLAADASRRRRRAARTFCRADRSSASAGRDRTDPVAGRRCSVALAAHRGALTATGRIGRQAWSRRRGLARTCIRSPWGP
ncbi:alpha-hydroxy-acid oxidizing protein [Iamia sp. SCSIO 61187]|uniref:alpha-hydroxy-acid oxidizing protein n=1 Tax=Iamia sp. SCSIO 61187 TaxID=2722752 RepID=UPI001C62658E